MTVPERRYLREGTLSAKEKKIEVLMLVSGFIPPLCYVKILKDKTLSCGGTAGQTLSEQLKYKLRKR